MRKIVFIAPSLQQGGLENAVTVMSNWLVTKGISVFLVTAYKKPQFYRLDERIKIINPSFNKENTNILLYYAKVALHFRKHVKSIHPDVVISYGDFLNPISILSIRMLDFPIYVSDRSSPGKKFPFYVEFLRRRLYPKAAGIIAQTSRAADQKRLMIGQNANVKIIQNPIRPVSQKRTEVKNVVLGVGRHYHVKGLDRLLEAFAKIEDKSWELHIAGATGPETKNLKLQAESLKIADRTVFLGAVKDIDFVFSYSKIFVLPSRSEGFPNALIEAMAHGLACVSFDINAGPKDIIDDGLNGILINDGDVNSLAKKIDELIVNENVRSQLGEKAKELKEKLSLEKIGNEFLDFISQK